MEIPQNIKEYLIFGFLCLMAICAGAYLTYRANSFDGYYEEQMMLEKAEQPIN